MTNPAEPRTIPAAFFGIVLGLAGLGQCAGVSRMRIWGLPALVGEAILAAAAIVWVILTIAYIGKWFSARNAALAELNHPVQCCFIGLIGVSRHAHRRCLAVPYSRGWRGNAVCRLCSTPSPLPSGAPARCGQGGRDPGTTTAVLYLPAVAGSFVTAAVASALGLSGLGAICLRRRIVHLVRH